MALAKATEFFKNVKDTIQNKTETEKMLDEALSKSSDFPSSTLRQNIAKLTFDYMEYPIIMKAVWDGLNHAGKNYRQILKALQLLETMVKHGAERVVDDARDHLFRIRLLTDFQFHNEQGQDMGVVVREKAKDLVSLLNDTERIRDEREKARKLASKMVGVGSDTVRTGGGRRGPSSSYDGFRDTSRGSTSHGGVGSTGRYGLGGGGYSDGSPLPAAPAHASGRSTGRAARATDTAHAAGSGGGGMRIRMKGSAKPKRSTPAPPSDDEGEGDDGFDPFATPAPAPAPAAAPAASEEPYDPFAPAPAPAAPAPAPAPQPATNPEDDLGDLFSGAPAPAPSRAANTDPFGAPAPAPAYVDPFAAAPAPAPAPQDDGLGGLDMFAAAPAPSQGTQQGASGGMDFGDFSAPAPAPAEPAGDVDRLVALDGFSLTGRGSTPAGTKQPATKARQGMSMQQMAGTAQAGGRSTGLSGGGPTMPMQQTGGFPAAQGRGHPGMMQGGYPTQPGMMQGGYPTQPGMMQGGYPTQPGMMQGGYPTQPGMMQGGYPTQPGMMQGGYPPRGQPGMMQGGYHQGHPGMMQGGYSQGQQPRYQ